MSESPALNSAGAAGRAKQERRAAALAASITRGEAGEAVGAASDVVL